MSRTIHIFTDASFDKKFQLGVSGYLLLDHATPDSEETTGVVLQSFWAQNNIRAELRGAIKALNVVTEIVRTEKVQDPSLDFKITLFTDCETIAGLPQRRHRLETNQFRGRKTGTPLNNADLYREFFQAYSPIQPTIQWVKGHSAKNKRNAFQDHLRRVDVAVRKKLRALLENPTPC